MRLRAAEEEARLAQEVRAAVHHLRGELRVDVHQPERERVPAARVAFS